MINLRDLTFIALKDSYLVDIFNYNLAMNLSGF
jgi:hypothetical protein